MKKFALVCLLALPVVALSQQEAAAWTKFRLGFSFNTSYESGGKKLSWVSDQPPPGYFCPQMFYGYNAQGHAMNTNQPMPAAADATTPAKVQPTVYPANWYYQSYYQPVNYYYQAPSYWYGN